MGKLENELKTEMRRTKINTAIINTVAGAGIIAVALVAPNVLGLLGKVKFLRQRRQQVKGSFSKMLQNGYISLEKRDGVSYARLTPKGERFKARLQGELLKTQKQKRWDGKWRVLIFDIAERKRNLRDKVRTTLVGIGFVYLQDSVWVYPHDCEDLVSLLKADFKIGKEMLYMIADKIENDSALRTKFGLPLR